MKIIVNPHNLVIEKQPVNEKEINVTKCIFQFNEQIPHDYFKEAYFTLNGITYKQILVNNECSIPYEVLEKKGQVEIGVVASKTEDEHFVQRFNPSPAYFNTWIGSLKDQYENSEEVTPTDKEQMEQAIQDMEVKVDNLDIEATKEDATTTITITKKDGTQEIVEIKDGTTLFASFEINNNMELICNTTDDMYLEFNINDNGELEVLI